MSILSPKKQDHFKKSCNTHNFKNGYLTLFFKIFLKSFMVLYKRFAIFTVVKPGQTNN